MKKVLLTTAALGLVATGFYMYKNKGGVQQPTPNTANPPMLPENQNSTSSDVIDTRGIISNGRDIIEIGGQVLDVLNNRKPKNLNGFSAQDLVL